MTTRQRLAAVLLALLIAAGLALRFAPIETGSGAWQACVVEDAGHRTPQTAAVLASPAVRQAAKAKGIAWHAVDAHDQGPDIAEVQWAIDAAQGHKLPELCIRHSQGRAVVMPLPPTPQAAVDFLNRLK